MECLSSHGLAISADRELLPFGQVSYNCRVLLIHQSAHVGILGHLVFFFVSPFETIGNKFQKTLRGCNQKLKLLLQFFFIKKKGRAGLRMELGGNGAHLAHIRLSGPFPALSHLDMKVHICGPSTQEMEAGGSEVGVIFCYTVNLRPAQAP